jgi:hypothetical protein
MVCAVRQGAMAKKSGTTSATYDKKKAGRGEVWTIRTSDGGYKTAKTSGRSALSIDKAAKRYAGAMKRLAKR